jgi:hypothetical protein
VGYPVGLKLENWKSDWNAEKVCRESGVEQGTKGDFKRVS